MRLLFPSSSSHQFLQRTLSSLPRISLCSLKQVFPGLFCSSTPLFPAGAFILMTSNSLCLLNILYSGSFSFIFYSPFLKFHFTLILCVYLRSGTYGDQRRSSESLMLELQMVVSCLMWMLESFARVASYLSNPLAVFFKDLYNPPEFSNVSMCHNYRGKLVGFGV